MTLCTGYCLGNQAVYLAGDSVLMSYRPATLVMSDAQGIVLGEADVPAGTSTHGEIFQPYTIGDFACFPREAFSKVIAVNRSTIAAFAGSPTAAGAVARHLRRHLPESPSAGDIDATVRGLHAEAVGSGDKTVMLVGARRLFHGVCLFRVECVSDGGRFRCHTTVLAPDRLHVIGTQLLDPAPTPPPTMLLQARPIALGLFATWLGRRVRAATRREAAVVGGSFFAAAVDSIGVTQMDELCELEVQPDGSIALTKTVRATNGFLVFDYTTKVHFVIPDIGAEIDQGRLLRQIPGLFHTHFQCATAKHAVLTLHVP